LANYCRAGIKSLRGTATDGYMMWGKRMLLVELIMSRRKRLLMGQMIRGKKSYRWIYDVGEDDATGKIDYEKEEEATDGTNDTREEELLMNE
jgi:hypothetical protein